jgi:hypothetical protein
MFRQLWNSGRMCYNEQKKYKEARDGERSKRKVTLPSPYTLSKEGQG